MIDVENLVISTVSTALHSAFDEGFPGLVVYGEYVAAPTSFPCVCIVEDDNYRYTAADDEQLAEHYANLVYTVNVYANDGYKKTTAREIAKAVDDCMANMKFTRTMQNQLPNIDRSIYRITMRYTAVVGEPITVSTEGNVTTTTYSVYRK